MERFAGGGLALIMRGSHYSKPDIFEKAKKCLYQSTINEGPLIGYQNCS